MSLPSKVEANLQRLREILEKNPSATHVYMRRCDKDNMVVDIPIDHAVFTIKNRPAWELVSSNKQMDDAVEALFREPAPEPLPKVDAVAFHEDTAYVHTTDGEVTGVPLDNDVVVPPKPSEIKKAKKKAVAKK